MPGIIVREGEDFESAYRKFKRQVDRNLIVVEVRKRRFFEPKSEIRKKEKIAKRKKLLRKLWMLRRYEAKL
ncbi:MAG: 30S ribosomal protein S21 [Nautilia sp.]|nr:MAG: 30S ribosomal protein S21 [Nautilia sp.]